MVVYQNDHIGTPQKITAVNGAVVWSAKYDSFGKVTIDSSSMIENNLRFAGQYEDSETGLNYNWKRYHSPSDGRYQKTDPIGYESGINLFSYVLNNPVHFIDPNGEAIHVIVGLGALVVFTAIVVTHYIFDPPPLPRVPKRPEPIPIPPQQVIPPPPLVIVPPQQLVYPFALPYECEDEDEETIDCDDLYYNIDIPTCRAISRRRGKAAGARCYKSAADRYGACLAGRPIPPLDTWNN